MSTSKYNSNEQHVKNFALSLLFVFVAISQSGYSQICVPFTQRTSQYSPSQTLYKVKGDFTMVGNTNLTLQNYGDWTQNGNNTMVYTDVDAPDLLGLDGLPTFNSSSAVVNFSTENGAVPACSNIVYAGLYWTGRAKNTAPSPTTFAVTKDGMTKNFDKRKIQLKGPASSQYTEFTANPGNIYYPTNTHDYMYSSYVEVTDYVRANGIGNYFAADIALIEGNGGGTGFYGGWGMIIIYENSKMKDRDITVFDGHAFVVAGNANFDIPVTSFNTVQTGPVGVKIGIMAGEGDSGIAGDYFRIQKFSDGTYWNLNHNLNTTENFFNSSIQTGGNVRNPNLLNNSGLDIAMFNIPNPGNTVIGNNQTSTNFKYGSMGDTYIIFAVALAVDAYTPHFEGEISAVSIAGSSPTINPTVEPGENIVYKVKLRNPGTEGIQNAKVEIPIPYNATYVPGSAESQLFIDPPPNPNSITFNPSLGINGTLIYDLGTLPLQTNSATILGELTFALKATQNCTLLTNVNCNSVIAVTGELNGTGAMTQVSFDNSPLILGYSTSGVCNGTALSGPIQTPLDATTYIGIHCTPPPPITNFTFCEAGISIPITTISGGFPIGTTFYNEFPIVAGSTIQYTITNPFPAMNGTTIYYALAPGTSGCNTQFSITVGSLTSHPTASPITYCLGATAQPLTANVSNPAYSLYYYSSPTATPQSSIVPSTATAGTFTYYVAEAQSANCIGPLTEILVTILGAPQIIAPLATSIESCSVPVLTLPYSVNQHPITVAQFISAGGVIPSSVTVVSITYRDVLSGSCPKLLTRTFTVSTTCGIPVTVVQVISIVDTTAPVIGTLPSPTTLQCNLPYNFTQATATDNCGGAVTLTYQDISTPGTCTGTYTMTRTWTATDSCGNVASKSQIINIVDTTPPTITNAQNITIPCANSASILTNWLSANGGASTMGDCSQVTWTNNYVPLPAGTSGAVVVIFTATDACGNVSSTTATATFVGTSIVPVFATIPPFCSGTTAPQLPNISLNGVSGMWNPAQINISGSYIFTPNQDQCASSVSVDIIVMPSVTPEFDLPQLICESGIAPELPSISNNGISGTWSPNVVNADQTTDYVFTPNDSQCAQIYSLTISVQPDPILQALIYAQCNSDIGLILDLNSALPNGVSDGGVWIDPINTGALEGNSFSPNGLSTGIYALEYQVTDGSCMQKVQLQVEVDDDCIVLGCGNIIVHNAISPNDDGLNDRFVIENIEDISCYPTNHLQIYNRWQVLIYETTNYDNRTRYFDGKSEGRATVDKSSELPTGTYFYLLQYTTSDGKVVKKDGYLYLSR